MAYSCREFLTISFSRFLNQNIVVMVESILKAVFSIPYLILGGMVAALLDISIHFTKSSTRLTFLEIWGCVMFWPIILIVFIIAFIKEQN